LRRWVTGREVTGELEEVVSIEVEEVVAGGSPEGGPGDVYARFYSCRQCWASKSRGL
jgi:hypothetical protein